MNSKLFLTFYTDKRLHPRILHGPIESVPGEPEFGEIEILVAALSGLDYEFGFAFSLAEGVDSAALGRENKDEI